MNKYSVSYREVFSEQISPEKWNEISLNSGGTQGTLQDSKIVESAHGFCYRDSTKLHTRNRFIYWRTCHDILELVEHSLDINLSRNKLRYRFVDTPILDGITIHETYDNIIVLVPTVCSVHRLTFPHPDSYQEEGRGQGKLKHPDLATCSIFFDATAAEARDPKTFHFFTNLTSANSQLPHLAYSTLSVDELEAIFVLAYPTGETLLVKQDCNGKVVSHDLKTDLSMPKLLTELTERIRPTKPRKTDLCVSLLLMSDEYDTYALSLARNGVLKVWSCTRYECIEIVDLLALTKNSGKGQIEGAQNHMLRKAIESDNVLAVFLSFSTGSEIYIFYTKFHANRVELRKIKNLEPPQSGLIDFTLTTTRIWSSWCNKEGDFKVYTVPLIEASNWKPVILEEVAHVGHTPDINTKKGDIRHAYMEYIFHPGRLPLHIINKAFNTFKRSTILSDLTLSARTLRAQIYEVIKEEINRESNETSSIKEILDSTVTCWQRFYSRCVQYYTSGLKPLGLILLPNESGAVLLKKKTFSVLRPMDVLEYVVLCSDSVSVTDVLLNDNQDVTNDVLTLFTTMKYFDEKIDKLLFKDFDKKIDLGHPPVDIMKELLKKMQDESEDDFEIMTNDVLTMLNQCTNFYLAIEKILELLKVESDFNSETNFDLNKSVKHMFTSEEGISILYGSLKQQIGVRYTVSRNLLLISLIASSTSEMAGDQVRLTCVREIVVLTQTNRLLMWLMELPATYYLPNEETSLRLAPLQLTPVFDFNFNGSNPVGLLSLYVGSTGGYQARKAFTQLGYSDESLSHWHQSLLPLLNCFYRVTWPITGYPFLVEWMLSCGQYWCLQEYIRRLDRWCDWNNSTHKFIMAVSFLCTVEEHKAFDLFQNAATGIFTEEFLAERCVMGSNNNNIQSYIKYYLLGIKLFENFSCFDYAVDLANVALNVTNEKDPVTTTVHFAKYTNLMSLDFYKEAYVAILANPVEERRRNNFRQFIRFLLNAREFKFLTKFGFDDLEETFNYVVKKRARSDDLLNNDYYSFLYAYQIGKGKPYLRQAASTIYEWGVRLNKLKTLEALEKQSQCFLMAKTVLKSCEKDFTLMRMPNEKIEEKMIELLEFDKELKLKRTIRILDLAEVERNYLFVNAKLKLCKFSSNVYKEVKADDPLDVATFLTTSGLFSLALELCEAYGLDNSIVFELLASKCVYMGKNESDADWAWLIENDIGDISTSRASAATFAWKLLETSVMRYEEDNLTAIHNVVCRKLINEEAFIPYWLMSSYKRRNAPELLTLFYETGRLEDAVEVATELITAALGYGKDYYGFDNQLEAFAPPFALPLITIVNLLYQLNAINERDKTEPLFNEFNHLKGLLDLYQSTAMRISNATC